MPIWAFHGEVDPAVPVAFSKVMVKAVTDAGGHAKLTIYPGVGHASWIPAYADTELYDWLFQQRREVGGK
jgi:predicted peptidase